MRLLAAMVPFLAMATLAVASNPAGVTDADLSNKLASPNVRVELLVVRIPQALGLQLVPRLRDPQAVDLAVRDIWSQIAGDRATLVALSVSIGRPADRLIAETVEEMRYPTEFDPHSAPPFGTIQQPQAEGIPPRLGPEDLDIPTAFEVRNTGLTLELEPQFSPAGYPFERSPGVNADLIGLSLALRQNELLEMKRFLTDPPRNQARTQFAQPLIRSANTTTALEVPSGKWELLNVSVEHKESPELKLFLLRCTALPRK
jgi:hypothetical protein